MNGMHKVSMMSECDGYANARVDSMKEKCEGYIKGEEKQDSDGKRRGYLSSTTVSGEIPTIDYNRHGSETDRLR